MVFVPEGILYFQTTIVYKSLKSFDLDCIENIAEFDLSPRSHLISNLRTDVRLQIKRISLFHIDKLSTSKDQK